MFPASVRGPGMNICAPDVCLTPPVPVPVPYVNVGLHVMAVRESTIVMFCGMFALNIGSSLAQTMGDEPGVVGGVMSGTIKGTGYFITGSPIVFVEGLPAVRMTSLATGNNTNARGTVTAPGVPTVLVALDTQEGVGAQADEGALGALLDDLHANRELEAQLLEGSVGYVRIDLFRADTARVFFNAQARLVREGARAFVLDLRGCPGGDLEAAYALAAEFLPKGALLGRFVDADGDPCERFAAHEGCYPFPLTIWVDGQTRSAAEAFAGAIQQHGRGLVIGSRTFGKGTARALGVDASGRASVSTSVAIELPNGASYDGQGIEPSVLSA